MACKFNDCNDPQLIAIDYSLTEQMKREKSKLMKDDISYVLEINMNELAKRINSYSI